MKNMRDFFWEAGEDIEDLTLCTWVPAVQDGGIHEILSGSVGTAERGRPSGGAYMAGTDGIFQAAGLDKSRGILSDPKL